MTEHKGIKVKSSKSMTEKHSQVCGNMYVTITDDKKFINVNFGKSGNCINILTNAIGWLIWEYLDSGKSLEKLEKKLSKFVCPNNLGYPHDSCIHGILESIKKSQRGEK